MNFLICYWCSWACKVTMFGFCDPFLRDQDLRYSCWILSLKQGDTLCVVNLKPTRHPPPYFINIIPTFLAIYRDSPSYPRYIHTVIWFTKIVYTRQRINFTSWEGVNSVFTYFVKLYCTIVFFSPNWSND